MTRSAEKIRSAALAICRKRGGAITRASRRKAGRAGRGEAGRDAQHETAAPRPRLLERQNPAARPLPLPATKGRGMMLKNVEAKTLPRVGAVASSPEVLDQLLLRRLAGKVSRCLALEVSRGSELSTQMEFPFTPVLTSYSGEDESFDAIGHNGKVETVVCSRTKGVQKVDLTRGQRLEGCFDGLLGMLRGLPGEGGA
jgi:hypothetical protein